MTTSIRIDTEVENNAQYDDETTSTISHDSRKINKTAIQGQIIRKIYNENELYPAYI